MASAVLSWVRCLRSVRTNISGIDPSKFLDQLLLGDKKPSSPMVCGTKPVAFMGVMGACDGWIQYGRLARDDFLRNNGCKPKKAPIPTEGSNSTVKTSYDCAPGTPVTWTEFDGGHMPIPQAEEETWKFFSQFK
jgi:hypothetical protein